MAAYDKSDLERRMAELCLTRSRGSSDLVRGRPPTVHLDEAADLEDAWIASHCRER